jgi:hypothetical protein
MREAPWIIPDDEARSLLKLIEDRVASSEIRVEDRDRLVRLRALAAVISAVRRGTRSLSAGKSELSVLGCRAPAG